MAKKVDCECGMSLVGETDDDIVAQVQEHAGSVHGMEVTRDQALAMAKPA